MDHPFRTAAVGGFNRQDVLTYLETAAKKAEEEQRRGQMQVEHANEAADRAEEALRENRTKLAELTAQAEQQKTELEAANEELTALRAARQAELAELETLREVNEALKAQVEQLRPSAEAYDGLKERTAGLELEAHQRAQRIEDEAADQVRRIHSQMELWIQRVQREYDMLRTQVAATVSHASEQIDRAEKSLEQVNTLVNDQEIELESLTRDFFAVEREKVSPPMPIPED